MHLMPPFIGQGLNSGFRDASALGWRIPLLVSGIANSKALLDSYHHERFTHVRKLTVSIITPSCPLCFNNPVKAGQALTSHCDDFSLHLVYRSIAFFWARLCAKQTLMLPSDDMPKCAQIVSRVNASVIDVRNLGSTRSFVKAPMADASLSILILQRPNLAMIRLSAARA